MRKPLENRPLTLWEELGSWLVMCIGTWLVMCAVFVSFPFLLLSALFRSSDR